MGEVISPKFKMPHIDPYDGTTNLFDHLESFKVLMLLHDATDGATELVVRWVVTL